MGKIVLAVDVGGTKVQAGIFAIPDGWRLGAVPEPIATARYRSQELRGLAIPMREFLKEHGVKPDTVSVGFAGPVVKGKVKASNIPWNLDSEELRADLQVPEVTLLNDLEAAAHGLTHLPPEKLETLQTGTPDSDAMIAVIAAGTGLGEALLPKIDGRRIAIPTEGGHGDYAAVGESQIGLLRHLTAQFGRVSYERVLGGPGIARIYDYLRSVASTPPSAATEQALAAAADRSAAVSRLALEGADPVAVATMEMYASIYGAEAGNMAVRSLAYGGLFLAGGIAPKILPFLRLESFREAFCNKGRASNVAARCPVHVVLEERLPLLGAAAYGAEHGQNL